MILSCKKNIVVTSDPDPHFLDPYNLLDPGFLDYLFLTSFHGELEARVLFSMTIEDPAISVQ